ncbi:hypothetical protein DFH09DRAFT_1327934 [Mycena vulgaris]|nr:hypothetical protein DFH09DRAFT_1327934 [Mycena vulgaris]
MASQNSAAAKLQQRASEGSTLSLKISSRTSNPVDSDGQYMMNVMAQHSPSPAQPANGTKGSHGTMADDDGASDNKNSASDNEHEERLYVDQVIEVDVFLNNLSAVIADVIDGISEANKVEDCCVGLDVMEI